MQLTPAVYRQHGVDDPFEIGQNIHIGTAFPPLRKIATT
jgi:hypothetical protein